MKEFKTTTKNENTIILSNKDELKDLYETIQSEENFVLTFFEDNISKSEIIISNNIVAKVNNGEIILKSEEK